jgi:hypothetical protein
MFELEQDLLLDGQVMSGIYKNIKDTKDMSIPKNDEKWKRIEDTLTKELSFGLEKYLNSLKKKEYNFPYNSGLNYQLIEGGDANIHIDFFMIQRYEKGKGKYVYHNDFHNDPENRRHRVITFIFYLNDIAEGGETEFWGGTFKIKPEKGKLVLFPASWTYPHRGIMTISDNKYIITNWFYVKSE